MSRDEEFTLAQWKPPSPRLLKRNMAEQYAIGEAQRAYLQRWQRLGPLLDAERHEALRRMTKAEYLRAMEQLWSVKVKPARRLSSGLVEWHRLFHG